MLPVTEDNSLLGEVGELDPLDPDDEGELVPVTESTVDLTVETVLFTSTLGGFVVTVGALGSGVLTVVVGVEPPEPDVSGSWTLGMEVLGSGVVGVDTVGSDVLGSDTDGTVSAPVAEELPRRAPMPRPRAKTAIHLLRP